jgi:hypothetical protein
MYERGYETSGSPLRVMLRRSSLVECVTRNRCLQSVDFFFIRQYVQSCLSKNPKYTFYTIKRSLTLAYYIYWTLFSAHCLCYIHIDTTSIVPVLFAHSYVLLYYYMVFLFVDRSQLCNIIKTQNDFV